MVLVRNKIIYVIIFSLISLFIISGCTHSTENVSDNLKFKYEYENLNYKKIDNKKLIKAKVKKNNPIKYSSINEIALKVDNKETFGVFFGSSKDNKSRSTVDELLKVCNDNDVETLYYVDIYKIKKDDNYNKLLDKISKYNNSNKIEMASVASFVNGEIDSYNLGVNKKIIKKHSNYAYQSYKCALKCLKEASNGNVCVKSKAC